MQASVALTSRCISCTIRTQALLSSYAPRRCFGSVFESAPNLPKSVRRSEKSPVHESNWNRKETEKKANQDLNKQSRKQRSKPLHDDTSHARVGRGKRAPSRHTRMSDRMEVSPGKLILVALERLDKMGRKLGNEDFLSETGLLKSTAHTDFRKFSKNITQLLGKHSIQGHRWHPPKIYESIRQAYIADNEEGIDGQLRFALQGYLANITFTNVDVMNQARLADLRYPYEWFPASREMQRDFHVHIGPTNSGKTYHALKRLEQADSGVYAGPLRLLAHEVYSRLNTQGKPCDLITGDERIMIGEEEANMCSCTVEMVPTNRALDVAVIDEIQMIGHEERGWAWTQALVGLRAREVHLCGEERALPLIMELVAAMGDKLHVHRYERLTPLETMSTSLEGNLRKLRKGDCLVCFSRRDIHKLKARIESITKRKVAVVYGSLPPEIRAQQARLFNDPESEYDILVASDAIGMGLNLSIKRVVFESTVQFSSRGIKTLTISQIKQIGGRAGRYRVAPDTASVLEATISTENNTLPTPAEVCSVSAVGMVTSLNAPDLPVLHKAMTGDAEPIASAGILPPDSVILRFASCFPQQTPFSYILLRLHEISRMHSGFHMCDIKDPVDIANAIQPATGLSISERIIFCASPAAVRITGVSEILLAYARCVERQSGGDILSIPGLKLELLDHDRPEGSKHLLELEILHKALVLYLWLSYRFNGIFVSQAMAFHVKALVEEKIDMLLAGATNGKHSLKKKKREMAMLQKTNEQVDKQRLTSTGEHQLYKNKDSIGDAFHVLDLSHPGEDVGRSVRL